MYNWYIRFNNIYVVDDLTFTEDYEKATLYPTAGAAMSVAARINDRLKTKFQIFSPVPNTINW